MPTLQVEGADLFYEETGEGETGAGHVPHTTHPAEFAAKATAFAQASSAR